MTSPSQSSSPRQSSSPPRRDATGWVAAAGVGLAAVAMLVVVLTATGVIGGSSDSAVATASDAEVDLVDDGAVADPAASAEAVIAASAAAMAEVTSVEFSLRRGGAPIFIDEFERIALDALRGQFTVPTRAQAELSVTVNDNLATRLGAVAIDDEVWISNPVTGDFETLPAGYDIDPSKFFDPSGGWQPLLANLRDPAIVAVDERGGERYHVRGVAPAAEVSNITVGLVRDQDVTVELWIHPTTSLVTAAQFETEIGGERSTWVLELGRYGASFVIEPPVNIRTAAGSVAP